MNRFRKLHKQRTGSTTLELAVLLPLLLTVALLCVDFGRFCHSYIAVHNAARAGAAFGMMHPFTPATKPVWDAGIQQAAEDELANNGWFEPADLTVTEPYAVNEPNGMRRVHVEVIYPFDTLINWPFLPGYNDQIDLRREVVMRAIR